MLSFDSLDDAPEIEPNYIDQSDTLHRDPVIFSGVSGHQDTIDFDGLAFGGEYF
jgi:hypothetical protein